MPESIYEFVLRHLRESQGNWPSIAAGSGVPYRTLKKIGSGDTPSPRIDTVEKLASYFRGQVARAARSRQRA